jgi:hypothetical protein
MSRGEGKCEGCHKETERHLMVETKRQDGVGHQHTEIDRVEICDRCFKIAERLLTMLRVNYEYIEERWNRGEKTTRTIRKVRQQ